MPERGIAFVQHLHPAFLVIAIAFNGKCIWGGDYLFFHNVDSGNPACTDLVLACANPPFAVQKVKTSISLVFCACDHQMMMMMTSIS